MMNLASLTTETRNNKTMHLDEMSVAEFAQVMNQEDQGVPRSIAQVLPAITEAITIITANFNPLGQRYSHERDS